MLRICQEKAVEELIKCIGSVKDVSKKWLQSVERALEENSEILRKYTMFSKNVTELLSY